jgi:glycosyltransferase involved in cell wall biosynthesis
MRIALTTWGFPTQFSKSTNGIAVYTARTAKAMAQLGHDVTVVTTSADGMPNSYTTEEGVHVYQAPIGNLHWYFYKSRMLPANSIHYIKIWEVGKALTVKAIQLGKKKPFDIIEVGPPAAWLYPSLRKLKNTKIVMTLHGSKGLNQVENPQKQNAFDRFWFIAERKAAHAADLLVAPSQYVANFYEQEFQCHPEIIPLPVEIVQDSDMPTLPLRILTLAATSTAKGSEVILKIIEEGLKSHPDIQFNLVAAAGKPHFEGLASAYPSRQVEILPWLSPDRYQVKLSECQIYLAASHFETFGLSVAEAMAAGKAILASDIPAHRELIGNNERGLLFQSDHLEDILEKLSDFCQSVDQVNYYGKKAQAWAADNLDPIKLTRKRLNSYSELFA